MSEVNGPGSHGGGHQGFQSLSRDNSGGAPYESFRQDGRGFDYRRRRGGYDSWDARYKRNLRDGTDYESILAPPTVRFETPQSPHLALLAPAPLSVESSVHPVPVADGQPRPRSTASIRKAYARVDTSVLMLLPLLPFHPRNSSSELVHSKTALRPGVDSMLVACGDQHPSQ